MLRNGRLLHLQSIHNLPHRPLLQGQIVEYLPPPRLRHSIKRVRSGSRSCHDRTIHADMGICKALFFGHLSCPAVSNYPVVTAWLTRKFSSRTEGPPCWTQPNHCSARLRKFSSAPQSSLVCTSSLWRCPAWWSVPCFAASKAREALVSPQ